MSANVPVSKIAPNRELPAPQNDLQGADEYDFLYAGYLLKCRPQPTPDGRFLAYVIVATHHFGVRAVQALSPDLPSFATPSDAAQHGLRAGKCWVDEFG
jgi:hypothetical protein